MADPELLLEDLLGLMDEDERARWDSGTEEQRGAIREELTTLWYIIPDPTDDDLRPPYMPYDTWQTYQSGGNREGIRSFYVRQWKRQRKAEARAELEKRKADEQPPKQDVEEPSKRGVDLFQMAKRLEAAEKENPPTADELAQRSETLKDIAESLRVPTVQSPDFSSLIDSFKKDEKEIRKRFADAAKPPEWPAFDVNDYPPALVDWSRAENERREADAEANARAMERALDNALKKAEDRAREQRDMDNMGSRAGFPPLGEKPPPKAPAPTSDKAKSWIHRIPVWKEFGHWLKWASAWATGATIAVGFGEYAVGLVLLGFCLVCGIAQIGVWQTNRNWTLKALLTVLAIGLIGYGVIVTIDQKGDKRWGVLWPKKPMSRSFEQNSAYSVLVFHKPEQQTTASALADALLSGGFRSSATSTYLKEATKQLKPNEAWVIYTSRGKEKLADVKKILMATAPSVHYIEEPQPTNLRQGDIQILLF